MADPKITFEDSRIVADDKHILSDGRRVGYLRKALHGTGYFMALYDADGKPRTWKNAAPGARIQQERDFVAKETYVKNLKQAKQRVIENP